LKLNYIQKTKIVFEPFFTGIVGNVRTPSTSLETPRSTSYSS